MGKRGRPPHPDILTPREWKVLALLRPAAKPLGTGLLLSIVVMALGCSATSQGGTNDGNSTTDDAPFAVASDVWVVNADGSGVQRLTHLEAPIIAGYNIAPAWSPDGTRIAFFAGAGPSYAESGHLYVMQANGTKVTQLAPASFDGTRSSWCESNRSPVWSPDGKLLAYQSNNQISVMNPDTGETHGTFPSNSFDPVWSPDGTTLAHSTGVSYCYVWAYSLQGTPAHNFSSIPGQDATWSPDGEQLLYVEGGRIMVADADGRNGVQVASVYQGLDELEPYNLQWSPDGTKISYMFHEYDTSASDMWIYSVDLASGGPPMRLVSPSLWFYSWSPDSRSIVYQTMEDDSCHYPDILYMTNADGSTQPRMLARGTSPSLSPDGTKIVFFQETQPDTCPTPEVDIDY